MDGDIGLTGKVQCSLLMLYSVDMRGGDGQPQSYWSLHHGSAPSSNVTGWPVGDGNKLCLSLQPAQTMGGMRWQVADRLAEDKQKRLAGIL